MLIHTRTAGRRTQSLLRLFSSSPLPSTERRHRWWERESDFDTTKDATISKTAWWEQKSLVGVRKSRRNVRKDVQDLEAFTVARPPLQRLVVGAESESDKTMDSKINALLPDAKSKAERDYLKSFLGKPSMVGHEFFDIEKWSKFWGELSRDFQEQRKKWSKDYKARKEQRREQRIRINQGIQGDLESIFGKARAKELWGPGWSKIDRKIRGYVLAKQKEEYSVLWAVPGNRFELLKMQGSGALETIFPEEYVPDFETFSYTPSFKITPEAWLEQSLAEHPLLFITESRSDPKYLRAVSAVEGSVYGTIDLSAPGVSAATAKSVRDHLVKLTNWPVLPQIFVSSVFLGGEENLEELKKTKSIETILVMAGAKPKHVVDREADKYRDLLAELVSEWRYKKIDKVTKTLDAARKGAPASIENADDGIEEEGDDEEDEEEDENDVDEDEDENDHVGEDVQTLKSTSNKDIHEPRSALNKDVQKLMSASNNEVQILPSPAEEYDESILSPQQVEEQKTLLQRLRENDRVDELYFAELRAEFLNDSAQEIERLTLLKEASKARFLIPEHDTRVTMDVIEKALSHQFFDRTSSKARLKRMLAAKGMSTSPKDITKGEDLNMEQEFNLTDGPTSSRMDDGESTETLSDEDARNALEKEAEDEIDMERRDTIKLIRSINAEMMATFGTMKRRVFFDHFTECLDASIEKINEKVEEDDEEREEELV